MNSVMKGLMGAMSPLPQNFWARTAPAQTDAKAVQNSVRI